MKFKIQLEKLARNNNNQIYVKRLMNFQNLLSWQIS